MQLMDLSSDAFDIPQTCKSTSHELQPRVFCKSQGEPIKANVAAPACKRGLFLTPRRGWGSTGGNDTERRTRSVAARNFDPDAAPSAMQKELYLKKKRKARLRALPHALAPGLALRLCLCT